ncbi:Inducible nitric oxide synthase [Lachnellula suecica]|uniref:nitric-oxide synthase (NADPH) n=1 Tax=Lachnellula suecica TaxID=602035 RepID=A0A8T9CBE6_9HELO|nr:Inducible nitric oxide synthase [Lachnellula suecica]
MPDGKVMGDPSHVQLTKDTMALGWTPPNPKTKWDVLPLVVMAEDDAPAFADLPADITRLVPIRHQTYEGFEHLDLNWVKFPALSRTGFDIGGIQYTAAPFFGWFMDSEIGVRNLADTFRYNALPDVAKAIGFRGNDLEDLPDHEKLVWLSRAQAELNFAVHSSFLKAGVTCISSLAASRSWSEFDDQHLKEKGYRLNADPYWISPPQGSIVPLWHRGFAPNYQPKPLIARHRFDPVKVWRRRIGVAADIADDYQLQATEVLKDAVANKVLSKVHIYFCGIGGTASKLAERLLKLLKEKSSLTIGNFGTLNSLQPEKIRPADVVLFVVATSGKGEVPTNGLRFMKRADSPNFIPSSARYSIFGLGDSSYRDSFNAASQLVDNVFRKGGLHPLLSSSTVESDVAMEDPPLNRFHEWWTRVEKVLAGQKEAGNSQNDVGFWTDRYIQHYNMLRSFREATMGFDPRKHKPQGMLKVSLEIPEPEYQDMGHVRLLPRNSPGKVKRVLKLLGIPDHTVIALSGDYPESNPTSRTWKEWQCRSPTVTVGNFVTDFVDLYRPFISMDWAPDSTIIHNSSAIEVLETIARGSKWVPSSASLKAILFSMETLRPRTYSVASTWLDTTSVGPNKSVVDVLVHVTPRGRFSDRCLADQGNQSKILYKLTANNACLPMLDPSGRPIVAVACGTCIGPIRSLVHRRIRILERTNMIIAATDKISLFLGFKTDHNNKLFIKLVDEAAKASKHNLLDMLYLVPSNKEKRRVQDYFDDCEDMLKRKLVDEGGYFYLCGNETMVRETKEKLRSVLGATAWDEVQERVIEEVF